MPKNWNIPSDPDTVSMDLEGLKKTEIKLVLEVKAELDEQSKDKKLETYLITF